VRHWRASSLESSRDGSVSERSGFAIYAV
jgi:hypothetical protein